MLWTFNFNTSTFSLADLANLATVGIGVSALVLSVLTTRQANAHQRRTVQLETLNQLRPLFREISGLLPKIFADTSGQTWGVEREKLVNLAEHADRLLRDVPSDSVSSTDLLQLARAFFAVWRNDEAKTYLEQAELMAMQASSASPRVAVLVERANIEFGLGRPDDGRTSFQRALDVSGGSDFDTEADIYTLLAWAGQEANAGDTQRRDDCLSKAEALSDRLVTLFRRTRGRIAITRAREWYARVDQGVDIAGWESPTALYWAGWYAAQGNQVQRDACLSRAEEVTPGVTAHLEPSVRAPSAPHLPTPGSTAAAPPPDEANAVPGVITPSR